MDRIERALLIRRQGRILKYMRLRMRLRVDEVSESVKGVSPEKLCAFESGKVSPSLYILAKLCENYNATMNEQLFFCTHPGVHEKLWKENFFNL